MTQRSVCVLTLSWSVLCLNLAVAAEPAAKPRPVPSPSPVKFVTHRVGTFRSEACGVGDFNNDGKKDIIAGNYLYLAPDWKPQQIRQIDGKVDEQGKGYYNDFMNLPLDVDGDELLDVLSCSWFDKNMTWYRNTGAAGGLWPKTEIEKNGNFEAGDLWDITGEGRAEHVLPHVPQTLWFELVRGPDGKRTFAKHVVSEKSMTYGGGVGDVNGDGRPDILRPNAWFEAPADLRRGVWKEHPLALGNIQEGKTADTPQIVVLDVNGDGANDIITGAAHAYGLFWYEQVRQGDQVKWKQHVIDDTWTQVHAITLADIDGDGVLDVVTGKRFMAHNGGDPDEYGPLGVYWYKLQRGPEPKWTKYAISYNEGIGAALNIVVVDLDGDGDLDVVVTGKYGGPVWFENKTKP